MAWVTASIAALLLAVPPPRPIGPTTDAPSAAQPVEPEATPRKQRVVRGLLIGSLVTGGVGPFVLSAVALPASIASERRLSRAYATWDLDVKRAHLDRAARDAQISRVSVMVGVPVLITGAVASLLFALTYRNLRGARR